MTKAVEHILPQIERLSQGERAELAYFLLSSLEPDDPEAMAAWDAEVARRMDEISSGRASGRPAEQIFAELREEYP